MAKKFILTFVVLAIGIIGQMSSYAPASAASAASCPEVKVIFARGSGGTRWENDDYQAFKTGLESKLKLTNISYEFEDLDYPAVGVGIVDVLTTLGAYFGAGDAYKFGASVNTGVTNLMAAVNNTTCPQTKYVLAGYSQGAMVVSKSLPALDPEKIIYAATFGDPKIYLPEGKATLAINLPGTSDKNGLRTGTIPPAWRCLNTGRCG